MPHAPYLYRLSCLDSTMELIHALTERARPITRHTFLRHVSRKDRRALEHSLGYGRDFPASRDWHISYARSTYDGRPCVYMRHSAIEHVFF